MNFAQFWTDYGSATANGAVVLSAIAAFGVIYSGRNIARRRGTLDLILHIQSDKELIDAREKFIDLKAASTKMETFGHEAQRKSDEAKTIRKVLNIHELTAVAIQEGVIDERVFRRWFNKAYIDDFRACEQYVTAVRNSRGNQAILKEFEILATRWRNDEHFYDPPIWLKRKWWALVRFWRA